MKTGRVFSLSELREILRKRVSETEFVTAEDLFAEAEGDIAAFVACGSRMRGSDDGSLPVFVDDRIRRELERRAIGEFMSREEFRVTTDEMFRAMLPPNPER